MGGGNSTLQNEWKEVVTSKLESVNPAVLPTRGDGKKRTTQEKSQMFSSDVENDAASQTAPPHSLLQSSHLRH